MRRLWPRRRPPVSLVKLAGRGGPMFILTRDGKIKRNWKL